MVITSLQEKENRKFYVPIRPGNRGGWSLFEWQSVREMPYRDREMYLGNSAVIGVLDKGGKWRKRDWYLKTQKKYNSDVSKSEQEEAMRKDQQRMNAALGIDDGEDEERLTEEEMRELMKRMKLKKEGGQFQDAVGLGFDKTKVQIRAKPTLQKDGISRLEGVDELAEYQQKQRQKQRRQRKQKKKHKKQKKHRHRDYSRSRSKERSREKDRKKHKRREEKERKKHRRYYSSDSD